MKIDFEYSSDESRHEDMEYDPTSDHSSDSSDFTESEEIDLEELVINVPRQNSPPFVAEYPTNGPLFFSHKFPLGYSHTSP